MHGQSLDLNTNALRNETLHVGDTVVVDEGPKGVVVSGLAPELLIGDTVRVHCAR